MFAQMSLASIVLFVIIFLLALLFIVVIILKFNPASKQTLDDHHIHRPPR